jgi:hypothetical protein
LYWIGALDLPCPEDMAARMDEYILFAVTVSQFDALDQINFGIVDRILAADACPDG